MAGLITIITGLVFLYDRFIDPPSSTIQYPDHDIDSIAIETDSSDIEVIEADSIEEIPEDETTEINDDSDEEREIISTVQEPKTPKMPVFRFRSQELLFYEKSLSWHFVLQATNVKGHSFDFEVRMVVYDEFSSSPNGYKCIHYDANQRPAVYEYFFSRNRYMDDDMVHWDFTPEKAVNLRELDLTYDESFVLEVIYDGRIVSRSEPMTFVKVR